MLKHISNFEKLYTIEGLSDIDYEFKLFRERSGNISNDFLSVGFDLSEFLSQIFGLVSSSDEYNQLKIIYDCKRKFVHRYALKKVFQKEWDYNQVQEEMIRLFGYSAISDYDFATRVLQWLDNEEENRTELEIASAYACFMYSNNTNPNGILFKKPEKLEFSSLIPTEKINNDDENLEFIHHSDIRPRYGFKLTDNGLNDAQAFDHASYCIYCHKQKKDSCRAGIKDKKGVHKRSPLGIELTGCPLDQKISEMNMLKRYGNDIGALAIAMLDNPFCLATGHRICNDCMRSCIYQKQEPVNIPGVESNIVAKVLSMEYGFEIYSLLTRWNPFNIDSPVLLKPPTNKKILVVGMGPAGFTLAHYLLNEGHTVVGIDGLKIEPLPSEISGIDQDGNRIGFKPIKDVNTLYQELDERIIYGFGGVMEYGITARWNKNYLKLIYILMSRRERFLIKGSTFFGGNISYQDSIRLGFHHIAFATGAGSPKLLKIKNFLARNVRMASDFLMSIQLLGAYKYDSEVSLQIKMPIVVIGGGLTSVDAATEALAYYPIQVEKFLSRYENLVKMYGKDHVERNWDDNERECAEEFISHAHSISEYKKCHDYKKRIYWFMKKLGGVKIIYRKTFEESPAYKLNHEELSSAMAEGIEFIENSEPIEIIKDDLGQAMGLQVSNAITNAISFIPAKTIIIAVGTTDQKRLY